jgi:hypothetical protein
MAGVALVIGLDHYSTAPLTSCVNDATRIAELLTRNGDTQQTVNYDVDLITSQPGDPLPGRLAILQRLEEALDRAHNEDFVLYFSGHGSAPSWGNALIVNDDPLEAIAMEEVMTLVHRSAARQVVVILDACYSGSFGEIAALGGHAGFAPSPSVLREDFILLAASRRNESALGGTTYSLFTELLIDGLEGGASDHTGQITAPALFGYAEPAFGAFDQRPTLKANVSVGRPLRRCEPRVDLPQLRRLLTHFPVGTDSVQLEPIHVVAREAAPIGAEQEMYVDLIVFREAGYVSCPDDRHLSDHANERAVISLTATGRWMRGLAARNRL